MSDKFKARYQVNDGYSGKSRPQHFEIDSSCIEDDMDDEQLINLYYESIQQHYDEHISPGAERIDEFVAWARDNINKRNESCD